MNDTSETIARKTQAKSNTTAPKNKVNINSSVTDDTRHEPVLSIEPVIDVRFQIPQAPTYPVRSSLHSVLSLVFMTIVAIYMYATLSSPALNMPTWVTLPFLFTIFGAALGAMFEFALLMFSIPFQQTYNRFTTFVQKVRFLNLAPVTTTIFFFVCAMVVPEPNLRLALMYVAGAACFGLGAALFFGGANALPIILIGTQVAQIAIVLASDASVGGGWVTFFLVMQAILQSTSLIIGTATPEKSTAFHVISTISGLMLFFAIMRVNAVDPAFAQQVAPVIPEGSLLMWGFVAACIIGLVGAMKLFPMTYNTWRAAASNAIWSIQYFLLVSQKRFPNPFNLSHVYKDGAPQPVKLKPYYQQHPEYLPEALTIPSVEKLDGNVTAFKKLLGQVKKTFAIIALMDHFFPQANLNISLKNKPRMKIWSDGSDTYPQIFLKKLFGQTIPGPGLEETPEPAIESFKQGQLLAYLAESGVANPLLRKASERGDGALVIDLRFLEKYETKTEYETYGGAAFFQVNSISEKLELISVIAPGDEREILADPLNQSFRHAESLILASIYFYIISGKHLAEIHMTYNLVEAAMHNAFDAQGKFNHPLRTFMYLHFFSHELAEELTTEHLVQDGAVFSQIFATTHDSLVNYLNDTYQNFEYGADEDFEGRKAAMTMTNGKLLPKACINWELKYAEIWQRYTDALLDVIYKNDAAVVADTCVQDLYRGLNEVIHNGLPKRYENFQTKAGFSRWASDTIHHLVIRHQVYGTTGVKAAMDPRISNSQVPRDGGTPGIDEWRSLICVALATARARFTLLVGDKGADFTYLLEGVDEEYKSAMATVFDQLQEDLLMLNGQWTKDSVEKTFNYNYFRAVPSELHTGPGY